MRTGDQKPRYDLEWLNGIFTYMHLRAAFTKPDYFCCKDALHRQYPTFQIVTKLRQAFLRYKIGLFSSIRQGVKVAIRLKRVT